VVTQSEHPLTSNPQLLIILIFHQLAGWALRRA